MQSRGTGGGLPVPITFYEWVEMVWQTMSSPLIQGVPGGSDTGEERILHTTAYGPPAQQKPMVEATSPPCEEHTEEGTAGLSPYPPSAPPPTLAAPTLAAPALAPSTLAAPSLATTPAITPAAPPQYTAYKMNKPLMSINLTMTNDFLMLALSDLPNLKVLLFCILLLIYVLTLIGNVTIIYVTQQDKNLHKPMYFFLNNLSFIDICYTSTTMPKMLQVLLLERKTISFFGCIAQLYFFITFVGTECVLLCVMSYDRFLAICHPLRYPVLMNHMVCIILAGISWLCGLSNSVVHTVFTFRLHFCGSKKINYFYCDIPPLLSLSCEDTTMNEALLLSIGVFIGWTPFLCIILSYIYIIVTIMKINSTEGRQKAFSTCVSHLTVVVIYFGSVIFSYVRPISTYSLKKDRLISVLYSVVSPMLNPLIYTLKNQDVKNAMHRQIIQKLHLDKKCRKDEQCHG
ncbi:olfactory receptor 5V1-like [Rhinophrynus dorsalis]